MDSRGESNVRIIGVSEGNLSATLPSHLPQACWYAIHTRSRHEDTVALELTAKQVEHYLPLVPCRKKWSDRYVTTNEPLFPGYVFVHLAYDNYDARVAVLGSAGVVNFIGNGSQAWPIPDKEVFSVRTLVQSRVEFSPYPYLKAGVLVEVVRGPLQGARGILVQEPRHHRLVISVTLFAQSISIEVDVADVRPCGT